MALVAFIYSWKDRKVRQRENGEDVQQSVARWESNLRLLQEPCTFEHVQGKASLFVAIAQLIRKETQRAFTQCIIIEFNPHLHLKLTETTVTAQV